MIDLIPLGYGDGPFGDTLRTFGVCQYTGHAGVTTAVCVDGDWWGTACCDDERHAAHAVERAPEIAVEMQERGMKPISVEWLLAGDES